LKTGIGTVLRNVREAALLAAFVAVMVALLAPVVRADERNSAKVSFLEGKATNATGGSGAKAPLAVGAAVFENDLVETEAGAKVELKTADGSVIRIGPASKMQLKSAYFGAKGEKKFSAKLFFGQVWSKVSGLVGSDSKFEVETDNAVAGVRGTTFRVDAKSDKSLVMKVYAGSVAMASATLAQKAHTPGKRTQIKGPSQISAADWEKLVGKMMQLSVNADGTSGDPVAFTAKADEGDEWAAWNTAMDEKLDGRK
jgi:hypothetical protein